MTSANNKKTIPGLIYEEGDFVKLKKVVKKKAVQTDNEYDYGSVTPLKKILLWFGVGSLMLFIVVMWIWNTDILFNHGMQEAQLNDFFNSASAEMNMIISTIKEEKTKNDSKIYDNTENNSLVDSIKEKIEQMNNSSDLASTSTDNTIIENTTTTNKEN